MFVPTTRATSQCILKERLSFIGRIMAASRQSRSGTVWSQSWDATWVDTVKRGPIDAGITSKVPRTRPIHFKRCRTILTAGATLSDNWMTFLHEVEEDVQAGRVRPEPDWR